MAFAEQLSVINRDRTRAKAHKQARVRAACVHRPQHENTIRAHKTNHLHSEQQREEKNHIYTHAHTRRFSGRRSMTKQAHTHVLRKLSACVLCPSPSPPFVCVYVDYVQHLIRRIPRVRSLGARIAAHANANALHYHIAPHRIAAGPVLCSPYSCHSYVQTSKWHTISMEIMRRS